VHGINCRLLLRISLIALLVGCMNVAQPSTPTSSLSRSSSSSAAHLYVVDSLNGKIYRYPLTGGLPQTSPDELFATVPGAKYLGVDGAQNIYAAGSSGTAGFIEKFSAGGTLLGTAQLGVQVSGFAVDSDGYLFVAPGSDSVVNTYAPSAIGSGSTAQPIATLTGEHQGGSGYHAAPGLTIAGRGPLYQASVELINVFNHPRKTSQESSTIKKPRLGYAPEYGGALALDDTGDLYADVGFGDYCEGPLHACSPFYWYLTDFDALSTTHGKRHGEMLRARNCYFAGSSGARPDSRYYYYRASGVVTGMAVYDGYVDAACTGDDSAVWVYRAGEFAHQKPVEALTGATIPTDAKVGP
jgi:hypothetical protein